MYLLQYGPGTGTVSGASCLLVEGCQVIDTCGRQGGVLLDSANTEHAFLSYIPCLLLTALQQSVKLETELAANMDILGKWLYCT